jgi:Na+-translocating ferredoxin:NAD+ oxidoreductase RnfE subunit
MLYRWYLRVSQNDVFNNLLHDARVCRNLPFGLCPGLGLTAYVVYGMILGNSTTLAQAFTAVGPLVQWFSEY